MTVGGGGAPSASAVTVAVAVKCAGGKGTQRAVRWASENLMAKADRFLLVHVMPTITCIPNPSGGNIPFKELDPHVAETYVQDMKEKCVETLTPLKLLANKTKKVECLLLEGDNPAFTLLRYISESGITNLVLGSCSCDHFSRKPKGSEVPSIVLKHVPDACNVYIVSSNRLITNSLNPMLSTEREQNAPAISKRVSSISSSSTESKDYNCILDLSCQNSQTSSDKYKIYSGSVLERTYNLSEDSNSDIQTVKDNPPFSPMYSEQLDCQTEIERLRLELEDTIFMYNQACEELVDVQTKIHLLSSEYLEEARRVSAAQKREESLRKIAAKEKEKHLEAEKEVEIARKLLAKESYERQVAEMKSLKESLEKKRIIDALFTSDIRYRKYMRHEIEMATDFFSETKRIGEGAYGRVYKCTLDHIPVAIKVLRCDASDRREQFLREVEVLSHLRHPNIVLLLGACRESASLVYEYMENGSLEDHIFCRNGRRSLPWCVRFRIALEVACGLLFLHNSKPEPVVHRDLKPGNILLDKYYASKIGDVGLAKVTSDIAPDNITEYRDSTIAGTLFYMDPEYQRTGTLRPKSDLYAFGVIILQLLASSYPNGLIMKFEKSIGTINFLDILDKSVTDWPLPETEELAQLALECCKLRCRDRPDLETEVLPALRKLAEFADASTRPERKGAAPSYFYCPILQDIMEDPVIAVDGFTYEHEAIKAWLDRHDVSPVTKQRLQSNILTPNHTLRSAIREWRERIAS